MTGEPALDVVAPDGPVRAVALVLHGGRVKGTGPVRSRQLTVARMLPFSGALHRIGRGHGLAVARLRYRVRGWNGAERSPVPDVDWALDHLAARFPDTAVALVGHSMGGRAAIYAAAYPTVRVVVGLAPWIEAGDPYELVAGRDVLVMHGDLDRITSPTRSAQWLEQARPLANSAAYLTVRRDRHAMLRRAGLWHAVTARYVAARLDIGAAPEPEGSPATNVVSKILAGQASLVV